MTPLALPHAPARTRRTPARAALPVLTALMLGLLGLVVLAPGAHAAEQAPPGKAWVRVGHFVSGMGATSIELKPLDGTTPSIVLAGKATYGDVSAYRKMAPGRYTATVRETSAAAGTTPLLSRSFEVGANEARTVAVIGTTDSPRLALLTDDLTPPAPGTARVRLLSASQAADAVTVQAVDGPTIAENAVLGQATPYATVTAGSWTLQLESSTAGATLQDVPVASGSVYTVVALDTGDQQVELQVVTDAAGAMMMPRGGAETGGGGTASAPLAGPVGDAGHGIAPWPLAVLLGGLLSVGAVAALRGRRTPVRAGR